MASRGISFLHFPIAPETMVSPRTVSLQLARKQFFYFTGFILRKCGMCLGEKLEASESGLPFRSWVVAVSPFFSGQGGRFGKKKGWARERGGRQKGISTQKVLFYFLYSLQSKFGEWLYPSILEKVSGALLQSKK